MVVNGEPEFNGDRTDEILNPLLVVEVLSPSTEAYDRGEKFRKYHSLASFCEYLLVSKAEPYIDQYYNGDRQPSDRWQCQVCDRLDRAIVYEIVTRRWAGSCRRNRFSWQYSGRNSRQTRRIFREWGAFSLGNSSSRRVCVSLSIVPRTRSPPQIYLFPRWRRNRPRLYSPDCRVFSATGFFRKVRSMILRSAKHRYRVCFATRCNYSHSARC